MNHEAQHGQVEPFAGMIQVAHVKLNFTKNSAYRRVVLLSAIREQLQAE
jgi:hypothetical protein